MVAELERRQTGSAPSPGLAPELASLIPEAETYVFCLFDGLGNSMLDNHAAASLAAARAGVIDAMFPTQTTVNMATVATGLPPAEHGLIAYQLWLPEVGNVVNTLKWTTMWGEAFEFDHSSFLPSPNLWERLSAAGIEPITVQPGGFESSPLTQVLYRGCRFESAWTIGEIIDATTDLAAEPGRFIFTYYPGVDIAAHMHGQGSAEFGEQLTAASTIWQGIADHLPDHAAAVGTADHGLINYSTQDKVLIRNGIKGITFYGNPRVSYVRAPDGRGEQLASIHPATWVPWEDAVALLGPGSLHPAVKSRAPDGLLVADTGRVLLPPGMDKRMIGYHGGTADEEMRVPLLVAGHE